METWTVEDANNKKKLVRFSPFPYALIYARRFSLRCRLGDQAMLSETERRLLEYIQKAKKSRRTVWLSEAIEALGIDPRQAVTSAKKLEARGLLKPKRPV